MPFAASAQRGARGARRADVIAARAFVEKVRVIDDLPGREVVDGATAASIHADIPTDDGDPAPVSTLATGAVPLPEQVCTTAPRVSNIEQVEASVRRQGQAIRAQSETLASIAATVHMLAVVCGAVSATNAHSVRSHTS